VVIRPPDRCLILTDSLSSIKAMLSRKIAHQTLPLVYECKQLCWSLCQNGIETVEHLVWHCERFRLERHRLVDAFAAFVCIEEVVCREVLLGLP
jgi:hypothetical protein